MLPIQIAAIRGNWSRFSARKKNKKFISASKKIFERDKYNCKFCNLHSKEYLSVVNIDNDYTNNKSSNLASSCPFCTQCFFLDVVGKVERTGGYLIYLPEISQADLNHFCRALFSTMFKNVPYIGKLHTTYLSLKDRSQIVEQLFGPESSTPHVFGKTLQDCDIDINDPKADFKLLKDLRLLPAKKPFNEEVLYWKKHIFDAIPL